MVYFLNIMMRCIGLDIASDKRGVWLRNVEYWIPGYGASYDINRRLELEDEF